MRIAYRRMSGAIGVSEYEQGTRGLWWEKRRALVKYLVERGHKVDFLNRMTKHSQFMKTIVSPADYDILMIEFGSSNESFYGEDLELTRKYVNTFHGPKIFINDDPDLPFIWDKVTNITNWTCWYNAVKPQPLGKQPKEILSYDMPFSSLMEPLEPSNAYQKDYLVYIGRPNSRSKMVKYLVANNAPWRVFGRNEEWEQFGLFTHPAPDQPKRAEFYQHQIGCLVLADPKHKAMGWRTGRAYHAIMAGCPALVESDHHYLSGFPKFTGIIEINRALHRWRDPDLRREDWKHQIGHMWHERTIADKTLVEHEL